MDFVTIFSTHVEAVDDHSRDLLSFLSRQSRCDERNFEDQKKYCLIWFQLAEFIYTQFRNEDVQLKSAPFWVVEESDMRFKTDCYWFDVIYQCNRLAHQCIIKAKADCGDDFDSTSISKRKLIDATLYVRDVIQLLKECIAGPFHNCSYFLKRYMPATCEHFQSRLLTLQMIGCWLTGVYWLFHTQATAKNLQLAAIRLYTCEQLGKRITTEYPIHTVLIKESERMRHVALAMYYTHHAQYTDASNEYKIAIQLGYPETEEVKRIHRHCELLGTDASVPLRLNEEKEVMKGGQTVKEQLTLTLRLTDRVPDM